jgi:hypothetical protein
MNKINQEKTISANSAGIVISYRDANKHQFMKYESTYVKNVQLNGTVKYQQVDAIYLSPKQKDLYSRLLHGFKMFSSEELRALSVSTKKTILINYTKAQRILNRWKQDVVYNSVDSFMLSLFPNSKFVKDMTSVDGYLNDENNMSFKDLGINQQNIINKFIEVGLLPKNFYQLI